MVDLVPTLARIAEEPARRLMGRYLTDGHHRIRALVALEAERQTRADAAKPEPSAHAIPPDPDHAPRPC